jgi:replicative superfamily II helicase
VNIADCVEYLTWTYFFRRLVMNPSYYELEDSSTEGVERHLTGMVEGVLSDLVEAHCIQFNDGFQVVSSPLGKISSQYYLFYKTVGLFKHRLDDWINSLTDGGSGPMGDGDMGDDDKDGDSVGEGANNRGSRGRRGDRNNDSSSKGKGQGQGKGRGKEKEKEPSGSVLLSQRLLLSGLSMQRIVRLLCDAYEFSELPVRHNEEHLNADLADDLPWNSGEEMISHND